MRVRLTPATGDAPKVFDVISATFDTAKGELTLTCRDGRVCLGLVGTWELSIEPSRRLPMACDEVERIHDGSLLVMVN